MDWIHWKQSNKEVALLVRTGGSRHTGLAAPPRRNNQPTSQPLSFWTEQDILQYIKEFNLPYASIYGDIVEEETQLDLFGKEIPKLATTGAKRTGCMFCMFGMSQDGCPNRFQKMKETHPNQYNYCMKDVEDGGLGLAKVLDFMGEKY